MPTFPPLTDSRILRPSQTALALELVSEIELLRLKSLARWYARGLPPDVGWEDLLQEALTRVLTGSRQRPQELTMVVFVAGIMRSLRAEHWRRFTKGHSSDAMLRLDEESAEGEMPDPAPGPERTVCARQELAAIRRLFAGDPVALEIIAGLSEGQSPEQIRATRGVSKTEYDSARRRMRRCLLREGLTCTPKK